MTIQINDALCRKYNLTTAQIMYILALKMSMNDSKQLIDKALESNLIDKDSHNLTIKADTIAEDILDNIVESVDIEEWYTDLADKFAKTFPAGKIPNTAYYYRGNKRELIQRLKRFMDKHKEYKICEETKDKIIEAAQRYNREMTRTRGFRCLAKYFIFKMKQDDEGKMIECSDLATYMENKDSKNDIKEDAFTTLMN